MYWYTFCQSKLHSVSVCYSCHHKAQLTGCLKKEKLIFSQFWKPEVQGQGVQVWLLLRPLLLACRQTVFSPCPYLLFPLCTGSPLWCLCVTRFSLLLRTTRQIGLSPTQTNSFNIIAFSKAPAPKTVTFWVSAYDCFHGGHISTHNTWTSPGSEWEVMV